MRTIIEADRESSAFPHRQMDNLPSPAAQFADRATSPPFHIATNFAATSPDATLRDFLNIAPISIQWLSADGVVIWANGATLRTLGYSEHEYIGHRLAEFHADMDAIADITHDLLAGEIVHDREVRMHHKDGSIRIGLVSADALRVDGRFVHARWFTRDVTEERALREKVRPQCEELETLFRTAPVGLALLDEQLRVVRANERLADLVGVPADRQIGHDIRETVPPIAAAAETVCRRVLDSGEAAVRVEIEERSSAAPGPRRVWRESCYPVKNLGGKTTSIGVVLEDITERKRTRTALVEQARITNALYCLSDRLHRAESLADVYDAALAAIGDAMRCDRASILLLDEKGEMRFVAARGLSERYRRAVEQHPRWRRGETHSQPLCLDDIEAADLGNGLLKDTLRAEGIRSLAFVPLHVDGQLLGKFSTYFDAPHAFSPEELELSVAIAKQLAFAIEHKRAEDALRESEHRLREMIDALPVAIYTTDADGRLTHYNQAAIELTGRTPKLGTDRCCDAWTLRHPDGAPMNYDDCPMAIALKEGRAVRDLEAIIERPDGSHRCVIPYPTPLRDASGRVTGGINMFVDITDRKQSERALREHAKQLALVTNSASVFIAHYDRDARYRFVNKPYAERFNRSPQECVGRHMSEIIGKCSFRAIRRHIDSVLRGETVEFDFALPNAERPEQFMHCSFSPDRAANGEVIGWVAATTDVTQRRSIENALRRSEEKLKEADRRKDEFLAMLAHELRNPLAPIANAAHLLRSEPSASPMLQQARAIIDRQTGALARLVDDLLDVSRITTGRIRLQMEPFAIGGIIERAMETVRPLIEQRGHELSLSLPAEALWVHADAARLEQVIVNLLTNAAKYTDDRGRIAVTAARDNRDVVVCVQDTGIGISADLLPHVFDLFTQSERSLDRAHGGLGIGLSLVQRLVSMHGGTVSAQSEVGKGSEFTVRLPLAHVAQDDAHRTDTALSDLAAHPLRVLVVDDNVDAARSLVMLLELSGHVVWMAHDGVAAIDAAIECRPHVIILDIGLPKLDGYAVAERLRREPSLKDVIIVAITGYGQAADRDHARRSGFDRHLVKPVEYGHVEEILAEASSRLSNAR